MGCLARNANTIDSDRARHTGSPQQETCAPPKRILLNGYEYYDKACSERFFHSLKVEAFHSEKFETRAQMRATVFEYIEVNYHRQ